MLKPLSAARCKALESTREPSAVGSPYALRRQFNLLFVKRLKEIEHRAVFVVEQTPRHMHAVVICDANEILIERTVVDRTKTQAIRHLGISMLLEVADDMGGIE